MIRPVTLTAKQNLALLRDLGAILNGYQDIEDALAESPPNIKKIRKANRQIGKAVSKHLPG